jgi:predicted nucleic acid-binding protein
VIVTLDLNVLLDFFTKRPPFYRDARRIMFYVKTRKVIGVVPAHGLTTIYYFLRKKQGREKAEAAVDFILRRCQLGQFDMATCRAARGSLLDDFEDAAVEQTAVFSKSQFIVTRDEADFLHSAVPAISPAEFIRRFVGASPGPQTPP